MKKIAFGVMALILMAIVTGVFMNRLVKQQESDEGGTLVKATSSTDSSGQGCYIVFETLSDKNQWLQYEVTEKSSQVVKRLVDAYNASVVMNSIFSDFDLQMRGYEYNEVVEAIKSIDVTKVNDQEVVSKLLLYKKEMLYLLSVNPDSVNQDNHNPWKAKDNLYEYLSKKYHVHTFGKLNEDKYWDEYNNCPNVPEWAELREMRGNEQMVKTLMMKYKNAKDFDARCIYAIELSHAYEADRSSWGEDDYQNPAIPIMESLMNERIYSLYLNELWQKWRVLYQDSKGASKDSEIPNIIYNDFRNKNACTILSYIERHPDDIKAINEFLVMACKENILREGEFPSGNQNAIEKFYLFHENYEKEKNEME